MHSRFLTAALTALILCSCAGSRNVSRIRLGMSYDDLVFDIGQPDARTVMDSSTTVYYYSEFRGAEGGEDEQYCVTVTDGKVARHGLCPGRK